MLHQHQIGGVLQEGLQLFLVVFVQQVSRYRHELLDGQQSGYKRLIVFLCELWHVGLHFLEVASQRLGTHQRSEMVAETFVGGAHPLQDRLVLEDPVNQFVREPQEVWLILRIRQRVLPT